MTALLALDGVTYTKHAAVRAALHRDLIQTGRLSLDMGRIYDFLMDLRETGDYGGLSQVTPDNARTAVEKASTFIEAIRQVRPELDQIP